MSRKIDSDFGERLRQAAEKVGLPYSQTEIASYLGVRKQNVDLWMKGSLPRANELFAIADKLKADARWLATGIRSDKTVYDGAPRKAEKILAVVKTLLHTDDDAIDEIVAASQALSGENGATGDKRSRNRRPVR